MKSNRKQGNKAEWLIPVGLILLSLVPVLAGAARIAELGSGLGGGAEITPENARFFASPLPVVVHILSVTLYSILGAFQFVATFRHRKPKWHRTSGRILVPAGLAAAFSGLWMTLFYPLPASDGELLYVMRLVFGSAMLLSIILGVTAVQQRNFPRHGEWMIRGYAIGLGAGTQVLTHLPWFLLFGEPDEFTRAMLMGAGWVINIAVAEWVIRRQRARRIHARRIPSAPVA